MTTVPVVDLRTDGGRAEPEPDEEEAIGRQLLHAFETVGFVMVTGHGIPREVLGRAYESAAKFFALPEAVKIGYEVPGGGGQRGYTRFGVEHATTSPDVPDLKEFFQHGRRMMPPPRDVRDPKKVNVEVDDDDVPGFVESLDAVHEAFDACGIRILRALSSAMTFEEAAEDRARWDRMLATISEGDSVVRCLHYPPVAPLAQPEDATKMRMRSAEHEDVNLLTLLVGASAPGLQVKLRDGTFVDVIPQDEAHVVVNVGDMMQALTRGRLVSTTHRVSAPPDGAESRFSMPFFMHPRGDTIICNRCSGSKAEGEVVTARAFLEERLRRIGLIPLTIEDKTLDSFKCDSR